MNDQGAAAGRLQARGTTGVGMADPPPQNEPFQPAGVAGRLGHLREVDDEAPGRRVHDQDHPRRPGASRACSPFPKLSASLEQGRPHSIDLSSAHLRHLARCPAAHRRKIGTRWRRITPSRQALLVLAHLRRGDTCARLAAAFGIGIATVYRYVSEAIQALAALAPAWPRRCGPHAGRPSSSSTGRSRRSTGSPPTPRTTPASTSATA